MPVATTRSSPTLRLLLALAVLCGVLAATADQAGAVVRASENRRLGTENEAVRGHDVVTFVANPADPNHIVALDEDFINSRCTYRVSFDGGATWPTGGTLNAPSDFDPVACSRFDNGDYAHVDVGGVAFGSGQNVYATFSWNKPNQGDSVLVAKSTDGGRTFGTGVVAILEQGNLVNRGSDGYIRPKIGVQPGASDRVHVSAWRITTDAASERRVVAATSSNGGATFGAPIDLQGPDVAPPNGADRAREQSTPVIGPDGAAYIAWRTTVTTAGFANNHRVARSSDGGLTWQRFNIGYVPGSRSTDPRLGIDRTTGTLYATYWAPSGADGQPVGLNPANPQPPTVNGTDIYLQRSTDRGQTWSGPKRLNDDPILTTGTAGVAQRLPEISVAPNGRVDVVFEDRRHAYPVNPLISAGITHGTVRGMEDYYLTSSTDQGVTFSPNRRISDRTINLDVGLDSRVTGGFYPPTLTPIGNDQLQVAWGESREGNNNTDTQDVYTTRVNLQAGGAPAVTNLPQTTLTNAAVALSRLAYPGGLETQSATTLTPVTQVVVVNEGDVAGALAGSVLARDAWGPLLPSPASGLPAAVKAEVSRLQAVGAFVIGGPGQLSSAVETDLAGAGVPTGSAGPPVVPSAIKRIAGATPAETARQIADLLDTRSPTQRTANAPAFPAVVIVNPASPDAAAAVGLAASRRLPMLFVDQNSVPAATTAALAAAAGGLAITKTYVVGGTGAVSDSVLTSLPSATRLGGADPAAVSEAVAAESRNLGVPVNVAYVADAYDPVDAAVVGTAAARLGGVTLLSAGAADHAAGLARLNLTSLVDRVVVQLPLGGGGYRMVASDGGIFSFGNLPFLGSTGGSVLDRPVVGIANTPSKNGYWSVASDGGIFAFGDAAFYGSTGGIPLTQPVVGMAATRSGRGYWLVASDGGIFAFGDAVFRGSTGGIPLDRPIVGMATTPSGNGYWLVASDGGIFAFGDAVFRGSTGGIPLDRPVVGMASTPSGNGYWLVASDGGIFAFGDAAFKGSTGGIPLDRPIVGMTTSPSGGGYTLVASDGGTFAFGDATFFGSLGGIPLLRPIVGIAA